MSEPEYIDVTNAAGRTFRVYNRLPKPGEKAIYVAKNSNVDKHYSGFEGHCTWFSTTRYLNPAEYRSDSKNGYLYATEEL